MNRYEKEIFLHLKDGKHRTAEDIYKALKKTYPTLWRGTVYRNLDSLYEHGAIEKRYGLWDTILREIRKDPHCHIFCDDSNTVLDIQPIEVNINDIQLPDDFTINSISVTIHGTFWDQICTIKHQW